MQCFVTHELQDADDNSNGVDILEANGNWADIEDLYAKPNIQIGSQNLVPF